jgi:phosphatidylglycerophosphate synthase
VSDPGARVAHAVETFTLPMTRTLVVVTPVTEAGAAIDPGHVVAGLPLVRRIVLAAAAAGYERVLVRDAGGGTRQLLDGTPAMVLTTELLPHDSPGRIVVVPANVVPQPAWLRSLLEMPIETETLYVDASMTAVVETDDPARVIAAAARCASAEALIVELRRTFAQRTWTHDPGGRFPLATSRDVAEAEAWLLRSLIKQREGFMSRHFERRISLALTRRLASTTVTPNAMTVVSAVIGLASAPFFLSASAGWQLAGALLFLAHSILDGCDGELARLKFLQSRRGAALDFWGDNVVHVAVFGSIAIGWSLAAGSGWPLVPGAIAVAATLGSAAVMFERTATDRVTTSDAGAARLVDALASRDFIYLLILASAFGEAAWFLVAVAVGTPVFLSLALWLDHRRGRVR